MSPADVRVARQLREEQERARQQHIQRNIGEQRRVAQSVRT